jgi:AraC-like DNA-binding protein
LGEEVRVAPSLPFKMLVADRRVALIPLNLTPHRSPAMLVHSSALLDALYLLFEILWERSLPVSFDAGGAIAVAEHTERLPEEAEGMLQLMAAGLNDKKIAAELGISASTLKRRIAETMKALDVRTRFQLGRVTGK